MHSHTERRFEVKGTSSSETSLIHRVWLVMALFLLLPLALQAQFNYTVDNGATTITKYTGPGGAVTIPGTLGGFPVKNIGVSAFDNYPYANLTLTSVIFPNSVTNISDYAFQYCYNLTNVSFGTGLISIGFDSFLYCTSLPRVTLPVSATNLDVGAFSTCESLTNIVLPPTLPKISASLLAYSSLGSITIPSSVTSIDSEAFAGCENLTNIVLPVGVTNIDYHAFQFCQQLKHLTIPPNVANIGYEAFANCYALENVNIPSSVLNIGDHAFWFCTSLTNISVSSANSSYSSLDGVLFDKAGSTLIHYPPGRIGAYLVPSTVTNIPPWGFAYSPFLTSVTVPQGVIRIDDYTFYSDNSLTNVVLPVGLKSIGDFSFLSTALKHLLLPNTITNIGISAFFGVNITSVTIPASVVNIGNSAFGQCTNLRKAYFLGNAPTIDGVIGSQDYSVFQGDDANGSVLFLLGTTGWQSNYGGWPTMQAPFLPHPDIAAHSGRVQSNRFVFNLFWVPDASVVVEATTNLVDWTPITTNVLAAGTNISSDSSWGNYPYRFYRAR